VRVPLELLRERAAQPDVGPGDHDDLHRASPGIPT
jgi:hypothetical protein